MTELSEEALDSLINSALRVGGGVGIIHPARLDEVMAELRAAGLVSPKGNLTKAGARRANREFNDYWNRAISER